MPLGSGLPATLDPVLTGYANLAALPAASSLNSLVVQTLDGGVYKSNGSTWVVILYPNGTYALPDVVVSKTANYTAHAGEFVLCDTTTAGFTITLPASPTAGQLVGIKKTSADANAVTISPNVDGGVITIATQNHSLFAEYDGSAWRARSGHYPKGTFVPTAGVTGDLILLADSDNDGSGDLVLKTGTTERIRFVSGGAMNITGALSGYRTSAFTDQTYFLGNVAGAGNKATVLEFFGTNGPAPGGGAWSMGVDTAAATPYRDWFLARWNADNSVTDFVYASYNNGNGVPALGIGWVPPPGSAVLNISSSDSDAAQGGIRIRHLTDKTALPLVVAASADGRIRQAFNATGGILVGGDPNLQGSAGGVQFLGPSPAASGTVDSSIWLSASGIIQTDALLQLASANTAFKGLRIGTSSSFPLLIQQNFDGNGRSFVGHNLRYSGATATFSTSHASFGTRAIYFNGSDSTGIVFYADNAATTSGSAATTTERMRIQNDGNIGIGGSPSFGGGLGVIFIKTAATLPSSNPTGGGILYVDAGALKYRGTSGTVTTLAAA